MSMTFVPENSTFKHTCFFLMFQTNSDKEKIIKWINEEKIDLEEFKDELPAFGVLAIKYPWEIVNYFLECQKIVYDKRYFLNKSEKVEQVSLLPFNQNDLNEWQKTLMMLKTHLIEEKEMLSYMYSDTCKLLDHLDDLFKIKESFNGLDDMYIYIKLEEIKEGSEINE